jgi:hypothetical protein
VYVGEEEINYIRKDIANMTQYSIYLFSMLLKAQTCWRNKDKNRKVRVRKRAFDCGLSVFGHFKIGV